MRNTVLAPPTGADSPQRGEMSPQATERGAGLAAAAPLPEGFAPSVPRNQEGFPKMICRASPQPTPKSAYAVYRSFSGLSCGDCSTIGRVL